MTNVRARLYRVGIVAGLFILFVTWWLYDYITKTPISLGVIRFVHLYWIMALVGGVTGFFVAHRWGSFKSHLGTSLMLFSIGLLFQVFGQIFYTYSYILNSEVPYPSIGDIGYFGSIFFYIYGAFLLLKLLLK